MKIRIESLPRAIIHEIFSYVEAEPLLELRFLNKSLFEIVGLIIQEYLKHYTYYDTKRFYLVQRDFIKKNSIDMKRLIISDRLLSASNKAFKFDIFRGKFNSLTRLEIRIYDRDNVERYPILLRLFSYIIKNVEQVEVFTYFDINLDQLLLALNPKKLKSLFVRASISNITLNDISKFKEFEHLKQLEMIANRIIIKTPGLIELDSALFPSLKTLSILEHSNPNVYFNMFGNIQSLTTFNCDLPRYEGEVIHFIKENTALDKVYLGYDFEGSTEFTSDLLVETMMPLTEINKKTKVKFFKIKCTEDYNTFLPQTFSNVYELIFDYCEISVQFIFDLLNHFPNVNRIRITRCGLYSFNDYALYLPDTCDSFLICIDQESWDASAPAAVRLLEDIDIWIF